jgi:MFS transporter, FSR family, fosmidomycin resistance protein
MNYRQVGILSAGHLAIDINQGALPVMLPFFISAYDLSYAAAAGIVFALNMASCIVQPLFGHAADRFSKPWLLSAGLMLAGSSLALTGFLHNYRWMILLAVLSGIGIAAYHPEAARLVYFTAGNRKGTAMSLFGVGGSLGFAIAPPLLTIALLHWGIRGTLALLVPAVAMSFILLTRLSTFELLGKRINQKHLSPTDKDLHDEWRPFARLTMTVVGRSILFYGLNTFIPIYWIQVLHESEAAGAVALTIFAVSGLIGNLLGGSLADRFGQKRVVLTSLLGQTIFLPILIWMHDPLIASLLLAPIGTTLYATYSPTIVLGQSYLPNRVGFSSGVTIGIAVAIGGGAVPIIGWIADLSGIRVALTWIACLPVLIFALASTLPDCQNKDM